MEKLRIWFRAHLAGRRVLWLAMAALAAFVLFYSLSTLTTKPRIWADEAKSIELARNFSTNGVLNIETAPGVFYAAAPLLQSTGYPVTVPLGVLFKLFGFHFTLARLYMLAWMCMALFAAYGFARRSFNAQLAVLGLVLVATFASFYDSGRTVVGELPGFAFLIFGLYLVLEKRLYLLAGVWVGFAVVAKPSVFLLALPALAVVLLKEPRTAFLRGVKLLAGMAPPALLWFAFVAPDFLTPAFWRGLAAFYKNPYSSSIFANVAANLHGFFHSTTLIYFSVLLVIVVLARFWVRRKETASLYDFAIVYSAAAFLYYLRSPGWLRYILIAELLILMILPHAFFTLFHLLQRRVAMFKNVRFATLTVAVVMLLAAIQTYHLFKGAELFSSDGELAVAGRINNAYSGKTVAVLGDISLFSLLKIPGRETVADMTGMPTIGRNPLFSASLPDVVVTGANRFRDEGAGVLKRDYRLTESIRGYDIFELSSGKKSHG